MVLTGIGMALCLFLSPTALLSGIMASGGPDRDRYGFVYFPLAYSSIKWYYGIWWS